MNARGWQVLVAGFLGCAVLIALGLWQLQRLETKEALLRSLEERRARPPISLQSALVAADATGDIDYLPIRATGRFERRAALLMLTTFEGKVAWRLIAPFRSDDGVLVLVDRGVVPDDMGEARNVAMAAPEGEAEITGYALWHRSGPGLFVPENDVAGNKWYWWDVPAMLAQLQLSGASNVAPFVLHLAPAGETKAYPRPIPPDETLHNNHLQYALTWFALAFILAVFSGLFIKSELKQPGRHK